MMLFSALLVFAVYRANIVSGVIPTVQLELSEGEAQPYFASIGAFSADVNEVNESEWLPIVTPLNSKLACDSNIEVPVEKPFILVVERGECSFEKKTQYAEAAGASSVIIVSTLEAIYNGREFGTDRVDYECENGEGWISSVQNPVWSPVNDASSCSEDQKCESGRCVVTDMTNSEFGTKVCCAWDINITMGGRLNSSITIQSVFMNMKDGSELLFNESLLKNDGTLMGKLYLRPEPYINPSSFILWAMGVIVAITAAIFSAKDVVCTNLKYTNEPGRAVREPIRMNAADEALDLNLCHTVGFITFASAVLVILFFFNLSSLVTIMYCLSAGSASTSVIILPIARKFRAPCNDRRISIGKFGAILETELVAFFIGYCITLWWYIIHDNQWYDWILQDVFGCCLCIMFLSSLKISSLKVAAALLSLAFLYDIFWVFLSPIFFSESVMVSVATGGTSTIDPDTCEKYPDTTGCAVSSLPMLLKIPRINSFLGGSVMLGLGDIVLPGLLLSFACRYDTFRGLSMWSGYFTYVSVGYAVGLMMANMAVIITGTGQPALLYLVPCTLGVITFVAWADGNLEELWQGPPGLKPILNGSSSRVEKKNSDDDNASTSLLYNL